MSQSTDMPHSFELNSREKMIMNGVCEIVSVNDTLVNLISTEGKIIIKGSSLVLGKVDTQTGALELTGKFNSVEYKEKKKSNSTTISKLFG